MNDDLNSVLFLVTIILTIKRKMFCTGSESWVLRYFYLDVNLYFQYLGKIVMELLKTNSKIFFLIILRVAFSCLRRTVIIREKYFTLAK
jgi:hypothetical protein